MNQQETTELNSMITALYLTRGQNITPQIVQAWGAFLVKYDINAVKSAFNEYIKYGDNFPSLPSIIKIIEKRPDMETAATIAWSHVMKAAKESSSKSLTPKEKEVLLSVVSGLTDYIDADAFRRGEIERSYKKLYIADAQGMSNTAIESSGTLKSIGIDTSKLQLG